MDVIDRLNKLRLQRNMSVYRLAELSGLNQSTLANTFSRGTVPSIRNLECMCEAMDISMAQFFSEDGVKIELTESECDFIYDYRALPASIQKQLAGLVKNLAEQYKKQ